jgi:hypothetical protein
LGTKQDEIGANESDVVKQVGRPNGADLFPPEPSYCGFRFAFPVE